MLVDGESSTIAGKTLSSTAFTGQSGNYITLAGGALVGQTIDATDVSFDGTVGSALTTTTTTPTAYAVEDKITDELDNSSLGYVQIQDGHVFVTPTSGAGAIQRGLNVAVDNDIVNIEGGTANAPDMYYEANIDVTQAVTIEGDSEAGVVINPSMTDSHDDSSFGGTTVSNGFVIDSSGVTIQDLSLNGGVGENFRNGIITDYSKGSYGNIVVNDVSMANIYRKGVALYGGSSLTHGDSVTDSAFDYIGDQYPGFESTFAIVIFDGDGTISGNQITNSAGGIGTNYLSGSETTAGQVTVSGNEFSSPLAVDGTAIGLDISGVADGSLVEDNTINMTGGSDGIAVAVQYAVTGATVSVENNRIITGSGDTGIYLYQNADAAHPVVVENNMITGTGSSVGILATDDGTIFGETPHVGTTYATITGNSVSGYATGVAAETAGGVASVTAFNNDFAGNSVAVASTGPGAVVNASGNWYGATTATGVASLIQGNVDYTPWMNKPGTTVGTAYNGNFSSLSVSAAGQQTGTTGRIQEAVGHGRHLGFGRRDH